MSHADVTVEQFTMQAPDFAAAPAMHDAAALQVLLEAAQPRPTDTVLDVACGPGILVAAIAPQVARAAGIDLTPAMIELARERCRELGLENTELQVGDVDPLPYADATFSLVLCRYALHHFEAPGRVIAQMARVCAPGGRVVIADIAASDDPAIAARLDRVECARDPSHRHALTPAAVLEAMRGAGLAPRLAGSYRLPMELDALLARSASPHPHAVRERFEAALDGESLGLGEERVDGAVRFAYPIAVVVGERGAHGLDT